MINIELVKDFCDDEVIELLENSNYLYNEYGTYVFSKEKDLVRIKDNYLLELLFKVLNIQNTKLDLIAIKEKV